MCRHHVVVVVVVFAAVFALAGWPVSSHIAVRLARHASVIFFFSTCHMRCRYSLETQSDFDQDHDGVEYHSAEGAHELARGILTTFYVRNLNQISHVFY